MASYQPTEPEGAGVPQAEALARATEKIEAVVRLAGGVAHDFNNLLTVIAGNAESILAEMHAGSVHHTELAEIAEAARRASTLTHQLLAFSRQLVLQPQIIDPNEVVTARWESLVNLAGPPRRLSRAISKELGAVSVDPSLFGQALTHLVRNAAEATREEGSIEVALSNVILTDDYVAEHRPMPVGEYVLLRVHDTGVGMDADTLARAFDPFFTTKTQRHGTGMGLPSVYGIVKQSGGYIWLESEPGRGTECLVFLPRVLPRAGVPRARTPVRVLRQGAPPTIVVAEDEDLVRELTRRTLERAGYHVVDAPNGHAALELVRSRGLQPDLLVTDIVMPGMDGRELAAAMEIEFPGLAVVLISGFADQREPALSLGAGRWGFLAKPFGLDELRRVVSEALTLERTTL